MFWSSKLHAYSALLTIISFKVVLCIVVTNLIFIYGLLCKLEKKKYVHFAVLLFNQVHNHYISTLFEHSIIDVQLDVLNWIMSTVVK
jgi:hypothetical protein